MGFSDSFGFPRRREHEEVGAGAENVQVGFQLGQTAIARFSEPEDALDDMEDVFDLASDTGLLVFQFSEPVGAGTFIPGILAVGLLLVGPVVHLRQMRVSLHIFVLAKSDVFAENKLFATLDTTVRKVVIENVPFLLSDTVGFIRKLPHQLVEAFKSTLDEVREADILMHVVDISHPNFEDHIRVVEETLKDIKAIDKPIFVVFNKIDAYRYEEYDEFSLEPKQQINYTLEEFKNSWIAKENTPCIFISAREKIGIDKLRGDLYKMVAEIHAGRYPFDNFLW